MKKGLVTAGACVIVVLLGLIIWKADVIGLPENFLERNARKVLEISKEDWEMVQDGNKELNVMFFYGPGQADYSCAVYLNHDGFSFGYFLRSEGRSPYAEEGVEEVIYEGAGEVLMSMNKPNISKIVVDNGAESRMLEVDPEKPFAIVLPINGGAITLYDAEGNLVEDVLYDRYTG